MKDWILNNRVGRFTALVLIVNTLNIPILFYSKDIYLGMAVGNIATSIYCALSMKIYKTK